MNDTMLILAGAVVLLLVVVRLLRGSGNSADPAPSPKPLSSSRGLATAPPATPRQAAGQGYVDKFRGGMIFPQPDPCEAVCQLRGKTFPEGRIPALPIPGCDRGPCACQVHQVVGRRRGPRRVQGDRREDVRLDDDRRSGGDRREL